MPGGSCLQAFVHVVDVLYAFVLQPLAEGSRALLGINRDTGFPGGPAAENAVELHSGFSGQFQSLSELGVAYACRKINKGLSGDLCGFEEQVRSFLLAI